jgi:hypothetical protein
VLYGDDDGGDFEERQPAPLPNCRTCPCYQIRCCFYCRRCWREAGCARMRQTAPGGGAPGGSPPAPAGGAPGGRRRPPTGR